MAATVVVTFGGQSRVGHRKHVFIHCRVRVRS